MIKRQCYIVCSTTSELIAVRQQKIWHNKNFTKNMRWENINKRPHTSNTVIFQHNLAAKESSSDVISNLSDFIEQLCQIVLTDSYILPRTNTSTLQKALLGNQFLPYFKGQCRENTLLSVILTLFDLFTFNSYLWEFVGRGK